MLSLELVERAEAMRWGPVLLGLCGGLALFLLGMEQLTDALRSVAGPGVRKLIARMTTNRFVAAFTGALVTAAVQSSTVTTVLVVGFVSAGLMTLTQSAGVILGANIGSTITAQLIAFRIASTSLLLIAAGFAVRSFARDETVRRYGALALGLGLLFLGMAVMSESTAPLRGYPPFVEIMERADAPVIGFVAGAVFTALVHSSAATIALVIALAGAGLVSLPNGIALALGANVGTCITAWLAATDRPGAARQAALIHVLFNVLGVLIWLPLLGPLSEVVRWVSPSAPELDGAARLAAETPRQIANAHTLFNVANALLFIGFVGPLARLAERLAPARPDPAAEDARPRFLDDVFLDAPSLALDRVHLELGHLGGLALRMVRATPPAVISGTAAELQAIRRMDDAIDAVYGAVVRYLGRLSQRELSPAESRRLADYMSAAQDIESMGDTIETNLVALGLDRAGSGVRMSERARAGLRPLVERVVHEVEQALAALQGGERERARAVVEAKPEVRALAHAARAHLSGWQAAEDPQRLDAFRIEIDVIENLRRLYYFARRIAKIVAAQEPAPRSESADVRDR